MMDFVVYLSLDENFRWDRRRAQMPRNQMHMRLCMCILCMPESVWVSNSYCFFSFNTPPAIMAEHVPAQHSPCPFLQRCNGGQKTEALLALVYQNNSSRHHLLEVISCQFATSDHLCFIHQLHTAPMKSFTATDASISLNAIQSPLIIHFTICSAFFSPLREPGII